MASGGPSSVKTENERQDSIPIKSLPNIDVTEQPHGGEGTAENLSTSLRKLRDEMAIGLKKNQMQIRQLQELFTNIQTISERGLVEVNNLQESNTTEQEKLKNLDKYYELQQTEEQEMARLRQQVVELQEFSQKTSQELQAEKSRGSTLQLKITEQSNMLSDGQTESKMITEKLNQAEAELREKAGIIVQKDEIIANYKIAQEVSAKKDVTLAELQEKVQHSEILLEQGNIEKASWEQKHNSLREEYERMQVERDELCTTATHADETLRATSDQLQKERKAVAEWKAKASKLERENLAHQESIVEYERKYTVLQCNSTALKKEKDLYYRQKVNLDSELEKCKADKRKLEAQIQGIGATPDAAVGNNRPSNPGNGTPTNK